MTFYSQLSQVFGYSGTLFNRPPGGTLLLRRLHFGATIYFLTPASVQITTFFLFAAVFGK
jgi:hypothetical protein